MPFGRKQYDLHDADMLSSTPDATYTFMSSRTLLPSRHVEAGFTQRPHSRSIQGSAIRQKMERSPWISACAWYKSNSWLVFPTPRVFFVLHCSSYPSIPMTSSAVPSNDVLSWTNQDCRESILFNSWGILYRFQVQLFTLWHSQVAHRSIFFFSDYYCIEWAHHYHHVARSST